SFLDSSLFFVICIAPFRCEAFCPLNVLCLCSFIAAAEQNDDRVASFRKVDAEARTVIDAQFAHFRSDRFYVSCMSEGQAIKTGCNKRAGSLIFKSRTPLSESFGLPEFDHCDCSF